MLSILTPTIRGREALLERCKESVGQLQIEHEHLIVLDDPPSGGCAAPVNEANRRARYPLRMIVADDDYIIPEGVAQVAFMFSDDVDFVVGWQLDVDQWGQPHGPWGSTFPKPGRTGAWMWHELLNVVAELGAESFFKGRSDQTGNDYVLQQRWVAGGARWIVAPVRMLVHRVG